MAANIIKFALNVNEPLAIAGALGFCAAGSMTVISIFTNFKADPTNNKEWAKATVSYLRFQETNPMTYPAHKN